jgi:hypothetical protein
MQLMPHEIVETNPVVHIDIMQIIKNNEIVGIENQRGVFSKGINIFSLYSFNLILSSYAIQVF